MYKPIRVCGNPSPTMRNPIHPIQAHKGGIGTPLELKDNIEQSVPVSESGLSSGSFEFEPLEERPFIPKKRKARKARNPKTGEEAEVPAKSVPFFKPGKELREMVDA